MFSAKVEQWRIIATQEANAEGVPPSIVLAVIENESGGEVGVKGVTGDLGLMQINPWSTLPDVQKRHPEITKAALVGKTENDARLQIRAGCDVLHSAYAAVRATLGSGIAPAPERAATAEQILNADLCYSSGAGAWRTWRSACIAQGASGDFASIEKFAGNPPAGVVHEHDKIPARKFAHARRVLSRWEHEGDTAPNPDPPVPVPNPDPPVPVPVPVPNPDPPLPAPEPSTVPVILWWAIGAAVVAVAGAIAYSVLSSRK